MMPMLVYTTTTAVKLIQMPLLPVTASSTRITSWAIHGWRPTSVVIQPASSATTDETARRHRRPQEQAGAERVSTTPPPPQYQAEMPTIAKPAPTIVWNDKCTTLAGGRSSTGKSSSPMTSRSKPPRASSEPTLGISIPHRTSPSTSTPPMTSGASCLGLGGELHRRELRRLLGGEAHAGDMADEGLEHRRDRRERERHGEPEPVAPIGSPAQHPDGIHRRASGSRRRRTSPRTCAGTAATARS